MSSNNTADAADYLSNESHHFNAPLTKSTFVHNENQFNPQFTMMLSLLTTLAFPVAFAAAAESYVPKVIHELFGAKQLVDVEKTSDVQPDYCYFKTEEPDLFCYK